MPVLVNVHSEQEVTPGQLSEALTLVKGALLRIGISTSLSVSGDKKQEGQKTNIRWTVSGVSDQDWPNFLKELQKLVDKSTEIVRA